MAAHVTGNRMTRRASAVPPPLADRYSGQFTYRMIPACQESPKGYDLSWVRIPPCTTRS